MPADVAEFVVLNKDFPRSIAFSIERMGAALHIIGLENKDATRDRFADLSTIIGTSSEKIFAEGLHEYLERMLAAITMFHSTVAEEFFR